VSSTIALHASRPFQFHKRSQLFIGVHNKAPSVAAVRVNNPDFSSFGINGSDPAQTPTGFAKSVGDDFPVFRMVFTAALFVIPSSEG
jgi:hypothetical protein